MNNDKIITIVDANDEMQEVQMISAFEMNGYKYIIYTHNERDYDGHAIVYAGRIASKYGRQYLINIDEQDEWDKVKDVMRKMAKYSLGVDSNA